VKLQRLVVTSGCANAVVPPTLCDEIAEWAESFRQPPVNAELTEPSCQQHVSDMYLSHVWWYQGCQSNCQLHGSYLELRRP
jgi:hypothetical protein